jgi:hypothetical protein
VRISSGKLFLALIGAASFYLISQKLNKRYSGEQEIAPKKITPIYNVEITPIYIIIKKPLLF